MSIAHPGGGAGHPLVMSRPQVGIERLPTRRMSNEPRESMNCKSCRKRKIKCNRLRPSCEACQVFQCPCIYDAVPKKRGPKTDVLEALLKRVDGLEAQLKDQKKTLSSPPGTEEPLSAKAESSENNTEALPTVSTPPALTATCEPKPKRVALDTSRTPDSGSDSAIYSPAMTNESPPSIRSDAFLDIYFARFHAKPYHILDEPSVRQRLRLNQLPLFLVNAIYAVSARHTPHPTGHQSAARLSEDFAILSRREIDIDEPIVDSLQALLLLVIAYIAAGKGKKAYMLLTNAVGMAMALELHREADSNAPIAPLEREMRRRLFWSCYLLDRFLACGSKRPCLIADKTIFLRLPCWFPTPGGLPIEGEFFQSGSNIHSLHGGGRKFQGGTAMLIDISRILGVTNRYLAAGGVRGDSHFPWHTLSSLSKIRQNLDIWASGTDDVFSSLDTLFGHPECTILVLSKLVYHLIYCLIYRPFLPIDLAELAVTGQHQSWQIEATNMCFLHANAITELVELGKQTGSTEWPAFVGYCICTAGTVHVHGAQYNRVGARGGDMGTFAASADFLSREMQQLSELRYIWASVQHQRETLQNVYNAHTELAKHLATNSMRYSPAFNLEDFFSRYANITGPGGEPYTFDAANLSLTDVVVDFAADAYMGHDLYAARDDELDRPNLKRKLPTNFGVGRPEPGNLASLSASLNCSLSAGPPVPSGSSRRFSFAAGSQNPPMMRVPPLVPSHPEGQIRQQMRDPMAGPSTNVMPGTPTFSGASTQQARQVSGFLGNTVSSPSHLTTPGQSGDSNGLGLGSYDPMFGTVPTNTVPSPAPWHTEDDNREGAGAASTPGAKSHDGSTATGGADEKDPFLSLLEQLAENENLVGQGSELDFILTAAQG
ncbi:putative fungal specific transcription factor [Rosellinia necatrix]|uniref:Putative fungal specific transcription factor n=1 Tax=Rosellinia necatrix TaxID=77044 RepID=A0A1W2TCY3_ROSNE|nr:putative fungal specific transcription factor [Rosellinia necatrix]